MGSKWKKVKAAIGLKLCLYVPKRSTESSSSAMVLAAGRSSEVSFSSSSSVNVDGRSSDVALLGTHNSESRTPVVSTTPRSSSVHRLSKSRSISSKRTCAICLGTMKAGQGHALFTAECSHSFHFNCIASNVKHGNQVCPICRAKWKDIPFQGPTSDLPNVRARITLADLPQAASMNIIPQLPSRTNSSRRVASIPQSIEPAVFNDDDPLDCQPDLPNDDLSARDVPANTSIRSVEIKTYPELSAVQQSTSCPSFTALINLKAHVTSLPDNLGRNLVNMPPISQNSHASVDLVTVLDISGSMTGTKLALLKRAMGFLIQNLGPSDRLSVIAFSSTASRLFPLRRMNDSGRQHALQAVNSLISNGGTNIMEGLRKGAKVMEDRRERNPVGSMMLLSDGQDTYTNGCVRNLGFQIPVHAFGFGADHDPVLMHSVAETSGGTFSFIEAEGVIQDAFAQCIGGLLSVVVQDLRIYIECVHPNVRLGPVKAGSYATQVMNDSRTVRIDVGSLYADEERDFLLSVNVPVGDSSIETTLFNVRCTYKDPVSEEIKAPEGKEVRIQRPEVVRESVVSIEVDRQRNRIQAAEAMAASRRAAEQGDLANAVSGLEVCRRLLSETISARAGDQFCAVLDAELKEMQERMASRQVYETSGRAYLLSGLSSHTGQRATTRGDSTVTTYLTPSMSEMLSRSQVISLGIASSPPLNVPSFFLDEPQPRAAATADMDHPSPPEPPSPPPMNAPLLPPAPPHNNNSHCGLLALCLWCVCCCGLFRSCPPLFEPVFSPTPI